jgi:DNA-binding CsgD family transcriptional regulator
VVRLVGRQREIARVREFLAEARRAPAALLIEGDAGIGKSALFEQATEAVTDLRLLLARCVQPESGLAYAGLADLLGGWTTPALPLLPPPQRRALEVALLRADAGSAMVEPHLVGRATLDVLRHLAESAPVLIAIDDVQWLDPASARVLSFVLRRRGTAAISVLATRRGTAGPLPFGLDGTPAAASARLPLGPLVTADARTLLIERFGPALPRRRLARVLAAAAGNPLYAIELAAAPALAAGPGDHPDALPPRLEQLLADRIGQLPASAVEPVAAVASLAAPTVALVAAALGEGARSGLGQALDAHVLRVTEGRLRFAHPLLGTAVLARLAPSARRALHGRLAVVATDPEEQARHLVLAADGPDAAVAAAVERGADLARVRGAPETAAELADAAVRLTPIEQVDDLRRRRVAAGYHWVTAGEAGRCRAHLAAALDGATAGPQRADLRWRLGMVCHLDGDTDEAIALLEAALAEAGDQRGLGSTIARKLAGLYGWRGRLRDSVEHAGMAVRWAENAGDPRILVESLITYALSLHLHGEAIPRPLLTRIATLAPATGSYPAHEDPEAFLAFISLTEGDLDTARDGLHRTRRRAEEQGDEFGLVLTITNLVTCELDAGRWAQARQLADEALYRARAARVPLIVGPAVYAAAVVHAHLGTVRLARDLARELVELGRSTGMPAPDAWGCSLLGFLALSSGDARAAHDELGPLRRRLADLGMREPSIMYLAWFDVDALIELGCLDEAEDLVGEIHQRGTQLSRPRTLALAARGRGLVRAARGDLAGACRELSWSAQEHARLGWTFEHARALLALGGTLRRDKQKRAARGTLGQAQRLFDELGAKLWTAKATAELARVGGRRSGTGNLTVAETRVAGLAADGCTNREVADRLFLSTKTVAAHLTSVYAKLGVRSRTELSRYVRDHPLPRPDV